MVTYNKIKTHFSEEKTFLHKSFERYSEGHYCKLKTGDKKDMLIEEKNSRSIKIPLYRCPVRPSFLYIFIIISGPDGFNFLFFEAKKKCYRAVEKWN